MAVNRSIKNTSDYSYMLNTHRLLQHCIKYIHDFSTVQVAGRLFWEEGRGVGLK